MITNVRVTKMVGHTKFRWLAAWCYDGIGYTMPFETIKDLHEYFWWAVIQRED